MENTWACLSSVSDRKLDERLRELARRERGITAELLAHLAEVDARRLCGGMAEGTTFNYCVRVLRFTEDEACRRIRVARTARSYPVIYDLVAKGELGLTGASRLAPLLTRENHRELLEAARGKTIRELEHVIAERFPRPDAPTIVRKLPERATSVRAVGAGARLMAEAANRGLATTGFKTDAPGDSGANAETFAIPQPVRSTGPAAGAVPPCTPATRGDRGSVAPLSPDRYRVQLTVSGATRDKLLRAQQLMRHVQPDGDLAVVMDRALTLLVDELERRKLGKCKGQPKAAGKASVGTRTAATDAPVAAVAEVSARGAEVRPDAGFGRGGTDGSASVCGAGDVLDRADQKELRVAATDSSDAVEPAPAVVSNRVHRRNGSARPPKPLSRDIPRAVRRGVDERDGGQCTFVGPDGRRCEERGFLQYHHLENYAWGGAATVENITLRCFAHNSHQAMLDFGTKAVRPRRGERGRRRDEGEK